MQALDNRLPLIPISTFTGTSRVRIQALERTVSGYRPWSVPCQDKGLGQQTSVDSYLDIYWNVPCQDTGLGAYRVRIQASDNRLPLILILTFTGTSRVRIQALERTVSGYRPWSVLCQDTGLGQQTSVDSYLDIYCNVLCQDTGLGQQTSVDSYLDIYCNVLCQDTGLG
ncbi:hypothetical protein PoB_002511400 [Plakobranchus ocellatus]|uniref:Fibronectin type-III domain-containing protein n=1 Tax=Plakobranchus ocellatus TaxID=259542 RepID=A0AAV3ZTE2_9GAST|nr:hypothetical protein PoB_002511400 [Plakobranchus ocellatus]